MDIFNQEDKRQDFAESLNDYPFFTEDKWFSPAPFAMYLAICMRYDGVPHEEAPLAAAIYDLLFAVADEHSRLTGGSNLKLCTIAVPDEAWTANAQVYFPDKKETLVHCNDFVFCAPKWISRIGTDLLPRVVAQPSREEAGHQTSYAPWTVEMPLCRKLISGLLDAVAELQEFALTKTIEKEGYSPAEALYSSSTLGMSFDDAKEMIKQRDTALVDAMTRIQHAHISGFHVEAAVLAECVISNILNELLKIYGQATTDSLFTALKTIESSGIPIPEKQQGLLERIHFWRKRRNQAVHGVIQGRLKDASKTMDGFLAQAKITSNEGLSLAQGVIEMYQQILIDWMRPYP